jgi:hypothetical protein
MSDFPIDQLRQLFEYDPLAGTITRLQRTDGRMRTGKRSRKPDLRGRQFEGVVAGSRRADGYCIVTFTVDRKVHRIYAHRLAWALAHGCWPAREIDHRDGDRFNNRLANLREADRSENAQNVLVTSLHGVQRDSRGKNGRIYYSAFIQVHRRKRYLGMFDTPEEAHAAYLAAKRVHHPFQPEPRA